MPVLQKSFLLRRQKIQLGCFGIAFLTALPAQQSMSQEQANSQTQAEFRAQAKFQEQAVCRLPLASQGQTESKTHRESQGQAVSATQTVEINPVRIEQARKIIRESNSFVHDVNIYIAQSEQNISTSHKLEGEARSYHKNLIIKAPLIKGKALSDATKQYKMDLSQFAEHAKRYNLHTLDVRKNYGQCQASKAAYEKLKKDLELHCEQFHIGNVPPPHICLSMDMSVQEALSAQNKLQQQAVKVAQAKLDLELTEKKLQNAITARGIVDSQVMQDSAVAHKEQELAAEFGRLKEEHRQLDIERQALARSGARIAIPAVKGHVKKS